MKNMNMEVEIIEKHTKKIDELDIDNKLKEAIIKAAKEKWNLEIN